MRKQLVLTMVTGLVLMGFVGVANAAHNQNHNPSPPKKYFVCKYVGKPGVDERLQTGQNPISVPETTLTSPVVVGSYFADGQNRSYVVAEDTGQAEPSCPRGDTPEVPKECPAGTTLVDYENGDKQKPICKGEPTGCPYGDSIPLDSPKCVPPTEVENTTPTPVETPETEVFFGK